MKTRAIWERELKDEVMLSLMEFFHGIFHTVLYRSGDYSHYSFFSASVLGVQVYMSENPSVCEYIQGTTKKLLCLLSTNELEGVEMHLLHRKEIRERFVLYLSGKLMFDSLFGEDEDEPSSRIKIEAMQSSLGKALKELVELPQKPRLFSGPTKAARIRIRLGISEESFNAKVRGPFQDDADSYLFPWKKSSHVQYKAYFENKRNEYTIVDTCPSPPVDILNQAEEGESHEKIEENTLSPENRDSGSYSPDLFEEIEEPIISPKPKVDSTIPVKSGSPNIIKDAISEVVSEVPTLTVIDSFVLFDTLVVNLYSLAYANKSLKEAKAIRRRIDGFKTQAITYPEWVLNLETPQKKSSIMDGRSNAFIASPSSSVWANPNCVDVDFSPYGRPIHQLRFRPPSQYLHRAPVSPSTVTQHGQGEGSHTLDRNISSGQENDGTKTATKETNI